MPKNKTLTFLLSLFIGVSLLSTAVRAQDGAEQASSGQAAVQTGSAESDSSSADTSTMQGDQGSDVKDGAESSESEAAGAVADFLRTPPLSYLLQGGIFMWPILLMGIIGAGVIIERYRSLKMLEDNSASVRAEVQQLLENDKAMEAFELCNAQQGPVPAVLATGLRKYVVLQELDYEPAKIDEQVVKAMDDYGVHIVAALERHLPILATISSVAPMLGFLGTVQGMIVAFKDIVMKMGEVNIVEAAASGIMVSLMTTCFGLIVGIPAYIAYNYFTSVINRFVLDVEESATELVEAVTLTAAVKSATTAKTTTGGKA